ncbi:MAG: PASTA domain-containing protein [Ruminococcus sp.]|nr:PASTA domain-containing protein [Ruminococcus sp.]
MKIKYPSKIYLIVSVCLILSLMISVTMLSGCGKSEVTVPDVVGMSQEEAESVISDAGLTMKVSRERYSKETPEGYIDKMDTKAGETLQKGEEVKVVISLGKGVMVPSMSVLTGSEAENLLTVLGLKCTIVEEYSDEVPEGNVISYTDPGATLPVGSEVTVTVSKGPQP